MITTNISNKSNVSFRHWSKEKNCDWIIPLSLNGWASMCKLDWTNKREHFCRVVLDHNFPIPLNRMLLGGMGCGWGQDARGMLFFVFIMLSSSINTFFFPQIEETTKGIVVGIVMECHGDGFCVYFLFLPMISLAIKWR